ncbi:50S ribosomal protein L10 [Blattabacterium cuenoti]|uniref:50S ribosomal protein L10 n=1 Tax=Blattabacterium cuenoti TaxID=1653831 RepID=UPI00163CEE9D|nr:50S ribosomal protein L10 [Blattabacterium cuenoti]
MKKEQKIKYILNLHSLLDNNNSIYIMDISGLNANQIMNLRKQFNTINVKMTVVKNTLLNKALQKNKKFLPFSPLLKGNTSILCSNLGNIPSKIIKKFHVDEKLEKPYLKGAYVEENFYYGNKDLDILIHVKSKKDLILDIIQSIKYPIKQILLSLGKNQLFIIFDSLKNNLQIE